MHKIRSILSHQGLKKYFFNTSWLFATQGVRLLAGFFVGLWLARYLGPDQFGVYNYTVSLVTIFLAFSTLGTSEQLVKDLVLRSSEKIKILNAAFYLRTIAGFLSVIVLLFISKTLTSDNDQQFYFLLICSPVIVLQAFDLIDVYYRSIVDGRKASLVKILHILLSSALKIYCIKQKASLTYFFYIFSFDYVSYAFFLYISYKTKKNGFIKLKPDYPEIKRIISTSWPLMIMTLTSIFLVRIDQIMIGKFLEKSDVGYYSAAYRIIEIANITPVILFASFFTAILNAKKTDYQVYQKRIVNFSRLLVAGSLLGAIIVFFFSAEIILILYKESYSPSISILKILSFNIILTTISIISTHWYIAEGFNKRLMIRSLLACLFNIVLNLYLVPTFKAQGAAISSLVTYFLFFYVYDFLDPKTRECFFIVSGINNNRKIP